MGKHLAPGSAKPPRRSFNVRTFFALGALAVLVVLAVATLTIGTRMQTRHGGVSDAVRSLFVPDPQTYFANPRVFILLVGLDYDYNAQDYEFSKDSRTDTIKVAALDLATKSLNVVSVPRDMDYIFPSGHEGKINEGYQIGGIKETERDIAQFLGIRGFDRYVIVRINALKELINAVGGIDLNVEKKMDYDDNWGHLHIHLKPGMQHLNGDQAVGYSRFRHDEMGDITRITRQDRVLRALIAKLKTDKFNDVAHIGQLMDVFKRNVDTNLSTAEMISLANAYSSIDPKAIKTAQVPYTGDKITSSAGDVLIPDEPGKVAMVKKLLLGPMGPEPTADPQAVAAVVPANVKIDVQNGSGVQGLGGKMATALRAKGFVVASVSNAATFGYTTTEIHVHTADPGVGEKIKLTLTLPDATVTPEPLPSPSVDATIIVGSDYSAKTSAFPEKQASAAK